MGGRLWEVRLLLNMFDSKDALHWPLIALVYYMAATVKVNEQNSSARQKKWLLKGNRRHFTLKTLKLTFKIPNSIWNAQTHFNEFLRTPN